MDVDLPPGGKIRTEFGLGTKETTGWQASGISRGTGEPAEAPLVCPDAKPGSIAVLRTAS